MYATKISIFKILGFYKISLFAEWKKGGKLLCANWNHSNSKFVFEKENYSFSHSFSDYQDEHCIAKKSGITVGDKVLRTSWIWKRTSNPKESFFFLNKTWFCTQ